MYLVFTIPPSCPSPMFLLSMSDFWRQYAGSQAQHLGQFVFLFPKIIPATRTGQGAVSVMMARILLMIMVMILATNASNLQGGTAEVESRDVVRARCDRCS